MNARLILPLALLTISSSALAKPTAEHKCDIDALVEAYLDGFSSHDTAAIAATLDPDYAVVSPYGAYDLDGWLSLSAGAWTAFPDMEWHTEKVLVDGDRIAIEYSFTGTFEEDFFGYTAVGQSVEGRGLEINEIDPWSCLIVETWNFSDAFGFFAQLQ